MKIGILQTGHVPEDLIEAHGEYPPMFEKMLEGQGFSFEAFPVVDGKFPASVDTCDGWLITGSRHGAYEDHAWIPLLEDFIRTAYKSDVPVAGICFGHQILAQALGGKVEKFSGGWGVGPNVYRMKDGRIVTLNAMHQDQVVERPTDAEVICSSDFCENAGLAYKGAAISFQAHPEFPDAYMADLIKARAGKVIPQQTADEALAKVGTPLDAGDIAQQIGDFFRQSASAQSVQPKSGKSEVKAA